MLTFIEKLRLQKYFAQKTPRRHCGHLDIDCYDKHPTVQALVKADRATMEAWVEDSRRKETYAYKAGEL